MSTVAMTGSDTFNLNDHIFTDLATGTVFELDFPNDVAKVNTGKNGNSVYALDESGKIAHGVLKLIRGSKDDKFLNNLFSQQQANFAGFPLMQGEFIKKLGDGKGNIASDTYIVSGGIFSKQPKAKMNVQGDEEQSITEWRFTFSNAPRAIT